MEKSNDTSVGGISLVVILTWFGLRFWGWLGIIACLIAIGMLFSAATHKKVVGVIVLLIHIFAYAIFPRLVDNDRPTFDYTDKDYSEYYSDTTEKKEYHSYFAPYTLVIDNGLDTDVELAVNNKTQHIDKKSHIILNESKEELSIKWNDKNYNFNINAGKQYVFNIDKINDYKVCTHTYGALISRDSTVKTVENELFFEFEEDYIDFWFEIPRSIEVPFYQYAPVTKYALERIDYEKRKQELEKMEKELGIEMPKPPKIKPFEEWKQEYDRKKKADSMANAAGNMEYDTVTGDYINMCNAYPQQIQM
ncbi:MAG: hypothetical protein LBE11_02670 [Prevotellaceae bacterium]|jgi:hypothetical protein|nr:hypothetical protein [Prevotellaceae bacterium]